MSFKTLIKFSPAIIFAAKNYMQHKSFDIYGTAFHLGISVGNICANKQRSNENDKFLAVTLEVFKFSIISSVSILIQNQAPLIKVAAKVLTEIFAKFAADQTKNNTKTLKDTFNHNICGTAAHHILTEYLTFDATFGQYAYLARPATRCVDYAINQLCIGQKFDIKQCLSRYLGNAAYLYVGAPKILSENIVEKCSASAFTGVLRQLAEYAATKHQDALNALSA